ncbi:thioredoxin family protein [Roseobacter sp. MH60115]|uniref:thioredoxin family protein n=1 Tax=Roseobacter sp. MH60115 TaxID=2785324 RepID=UPI0018A26878|nr:thioredoxin family protein [Roseobacter sp. MH60115]
MLLNTPVCDFGWKAPDFTLADPDGTSFTMSDHLGDKGLMIAFICNHCPYVQAIGDRLAQDARTLMEDGIHFVAVMSNDYRQVPQDNPENMKLFAKQFGFPFLYLVDHDQSVGTAYSAVCTPDFFGLNSDGALQYRGRLDSAAMGDPQDRVPELLNAARQIAEKGKGPTTQTPSMGCSIKWRR